MKLDERAALIEDLEREKEAAWQRKQQRQHEAATCIQTAVRNWMKRWRMLNSAQALKKEVRGECGEVSRGAGKGTHRLLFDRPEWQTASSGCETRRLARCGQR